MTSDPLVTAPLSTGSPVPADGSPYWIYEEVAAAQLAAWIPDEPQRVLDLSGGRTRFAAQLGWSRGTRCCTSGPPAAPASR